jgi:hypothetical protein
MFRKQNKTNAEREEKNSGNECCTKKQKKPPPTYQNPRPAAMNNFFAPLRDLPTENAETGSEVNYTKTPGTNESTDKGKPSPIALTSEANLFSHTYVHLVKDTCRGGM